MQFIPSQLYKWSGLSGLVILRKRLFHFAGMFKILSELCKIGPLNQTQALPITTLICVNYLIGWCNVITYRELGIGIVPYSPLGRGFFGGKAVLESVAANSFLVNVSSPIFLLSSLYYQMFPIMFFKL